MLDFDNAGAHRTGVFHLFRQQTTLVEVTGEHQLGDGESAGLCPFQMMAAKGAPTVFLAECFGH